MPWLYTKVNILLSPTQFTLTDYNRVGVKRYQMFIFSVQFQTEGSLPSVQAQGRLCRGMAFGQSYTVSHMDVNVTCRNLQYTRIAEVSFVEC